MTVTKIEQQSLFDYDSLDSDTRAFVQEKAQVIHARLKRTAEDIIAIGQDLIAVNEKLARIHKFLPWLRQEFDMTRQTAYRFMAVAKKFGNCNIMLQFSPTDLYNLLEAPDTIIEQVESGQISPTLTAIQKAKQQAQIDADKEQDAATIAPIEIFPGWKISQTNEDIPLPATWNHVNGKPFDMPLPDGKPVEVPEEWKLPPEMRGGSQVEAETPQKEGKEDMALSILLSANRGVPAALQSSESNEWFTPAEYVNAARELMGVIDLDPASCEEANHTVKAERFYTKRENGLHQSWRGRIWLNPPYGVEGGRSNQHVWTNQLIQRYQSGLVAEAVLLVNANTEAKWFQPLYNYLICFTNHRIRFHSTDGESSQPTQGTALVYFGLQRIRFIEIFSRFGTVVERAKE